MKNYFLQICLLMLTAYTSFSQSTAVTNPKSEEVNLKDVAKRIDNDWVWFDQTLALRTENYFKIFKKSLGLSSLDSMHLVKVNSDRFDFKIYRYQQYHKGIPIEHAEYILEVRNEIVEVGHGHLAKNVNLPVSYGLDEKSALEKAKASTKFSKFAWEIDSLQKVVKELKKDPNATLLPEAKLIFADMNPIGIDKNDYRLSFKFDIMGSGNEEIPTYDIYVDAGTGGINKKISNVRECFAHKTNTPPMSLSKLNKTHVHSLANETVGTAIPLFGRYGNPVSFTHQNNNGVYKLGKGIPGFLDAFYWNNPNTPITTTNANGAWGTSNQDATTMYWALERTDDYFRQFRNGINNYNAPVTAYAKWGGPGNANAQYYNNGFYFHFLRFGQTFNGTDVISLDIVGHEYGHGVTWSGPNLAYQGFAGAINESVSDMFGTTIEWRTLGDPNYLIGEDVFGSGLRDMQNPNNHQQPATVGGTYWQNPIGCTPNGDPNSPGYNDFCYVHTNSGVPNRWFYLVSTGFGGNDVQNAGFIALGMLDRLTSNSNFNDARNASIQATNYYFGGPCSPMTRIVENAWAAVGVGAPSNCPGRLAAPEVSESKINEGYPVIYPNPVSDVVKVELKSSETRTGDRAFLLYNLQGQKMAEVITPNNSAAINVSSLPAGVYILQVKLAKDSNGSTIMKQQVIVQH